MTYFLCSLAAFIAAFSSSVFSPSVGADDIQREITLLPPLLLLARIETLRILEGANADTSRREDDTNIVTNSNNAILLNLFFVP